MIYDLNQPRGRHFSAFSILIKYAGGAWTRAVAWDEGEMA